MVRDANPKEPVEDVNAAENNRPSNGSPDGSANVHSAHAGMAAAARYGWNILTVSRLQTNST